jgi:hypothetical protein
MARPESDAAPKAAKPINTSGFEKTRSTLNVGADEERLPRRAFERKPDQRSPYGKRGIRTGHIVIE